MDAENDELLDYEENPYDGVPRSSHRNYDILLEGVLNEVLELLRQYFKKASINWSYSSPLSVNLVIKIEGDSNYSFEDGIKEYRSQNLYNRNYSKRLQFSNGKRKNVKPRASGKKRKI